MEEEIIEKKARKRKKFSNKYDAKRRRIWYRKKKLAEREKEKEERHAQLIAEGMPEPGTKEYFAWIAKRNCGPRKKSKPKPKVKEKREPRPKAKVKKRRVGRPKKRGRKKNYYQRAKAKAAAAKKIDRRRVPSKQRLYWKVAEYINGSEKVSHGKFKTREEAYAVFNRLKEELGHCDFPNKLTIVHGEHYPRETDSQVLLLQRDWDGGKESVTSRNEFGKVIEQQTQSVRNSKTLGAKWVIYDQFKFDIEETFNVLGYNPRNERKTFRWIYENIVCKDVEIYEYRRVIKYKKYIIIKGDNGICGVIKCKTSSDAVRFYNTLSNWVKRDKVEWLYMIGSVDDSLEKKTKIMAELAMYKKNNSA